MRCSDYRIRPPNIGQALPRGCAACALFVSFTVGAIAQDLGVIGPVYPIVEPSLLEVIVAKLKRAEASGLLGKLQRDAQARIKRGIEEPTAIATVSRTSQARTHYYDPTLVVPYAITDTDGKIIVAPGTTVNPLDTVSLSKYLLFFDARDAQQVKRARVILDQHNGRVKLILTGGSYLDLMKHWQMPVFFDQQGLLTSRFNIRQVPALVYQEGRRLRIDEIL
jgi:conjugal transfer pilus assembly protein TraW